MRSGNISPNTLEQWIPLKGSQSGGLCGKECASIWTLARTLRRLTDEGVVEQVGFGNDARFRLRIRR